MMDGAIIFITGWYPPTEAISNSNMRNVNVQYQMSDFLVIVSIDIFDHGGAMNIILPINPSNTLRYA